MNSFIKALALGAGVAALGVVTVGIADAATDYLHSKRQKRHKAPPINRLKLSASSRYTAKFSCN